MMPPQVLVDTSWRSRPWCHRKVAPHRTSPIRLFSILTISSRKAFCLIAKPHLILLHFSDWTRLLFLHCFFSCLASLVYHSVQLASLSLDIQPKFHVSRPLNQPSNFISAQPHHVLHPC